MIGLEPTTKYDKEDSSFYNRDCCLFLYPNLKGKERWRMDSKLLYNQIKEQLPPMEGVAVKVEDNKMNFYIDGRLEFYVR